MASQEGASAMSENNEDSFREFEKENSERSEINKENKKEKQRPWVIDDFEIGKFLTINIS